VPVAWSSSDSLVADVSPDGTVTARRAGTVAISARAGGRAADVALRVVARRLALAVPSRLVTLGVGEAARVPVRVVDENRGGRPVRDAAPRVRAGSRVQVAFSASAQELTIVGRAAGQDTVRVTLGGETRIVPVRVTPRAAAEPATPEASEPSRGPAAPPAEMARRLASDVATRMQWYTRGAGYRDPLRQQLAAHRNDPVIQAALLRALQDEPERCTAGALALHSSGGRPAMRFTVTCRWRRGPLGVGAEEYVAAFDAPLAQARNGWAIAALELRQWRRR
jgi:hypothetical protein